MDLPPGFTVTLPGGVRTVRCDACGEGRADPFGQEDVEGWAREHECAASTTTSPTVR